MDIRGTSLTRNSGHLGAWSRTMPRALWWSWGGGDLVRERLVDTLRLVEEQVHLGVWG